MSSKTLMGRKKRPVDTLQKLAIYASAGISVAIPLGIIGYVFVKGLGTVNWTFLTTVTSARKQTTGILGNIIGLVITPILSVYGMWISFLSNLL